MVFYPLADNLLNLLRYEVCNSVIIVRMGIDKSAILGSRKLLCLRVMGVFGVVSMAWGWSVLRDIWLISTNKNGSVVTHGKYQWLLLFFD
jgi:hypothetical protein